MIFGEPGRCEMSCVGILCKHRCIMQIAWSPWRMISVGNVHSKSSFENLHWKTKFSKFSKLHWKPSSKSLHSKPPIGDSQWCRATSSNGRQSNDCQVLWNLFKHTEKFSVKTHQNRCSIFSAGNSHSGVLLKEFINYPSRRRFIMLQHSAAAFSNWTSVASIPGISIPLAYSLVLVQLCASLNDSHQIRK